MDYINAFWVGGLICVIGQILIDKCPEIIHKNTSEGSFYNEA